MKGDVFAEDDARRRREHAEQRRNLSDARGDETRDDGVAEDVRFVDDGFHLAHDVSRRAGDAVETVGRDGAAARGFVRDHRAVHLFFLVFALGNDLALDGDGFRRGVDALHPKQRRAHEVFDAASKGFETRRHRVDRRGGGGGGDDG